MTPSTHFDIPQFSCLIRCEFLFDFKSGFDQYLPATVFAVTSYVGHLPTFQVLVEGKYVYSYVPVHALTSSPRLPLLQGEASYHNCPTPNLAVSVHHALQRKCQVFDRQGVWRIGGHYRMTFDWYDDNKLCHLVEQDDGNLIIWPSHKLIFSDEKGQLPGYKKLHREWIL